jgi:hypothetical protein
MCDRRRVEPIRRAAEERGEGATPPRGAADPFCGPLLVEAAAAVVGDDELVVRIADEHG